MHYRTAIIQSLSEVGQSAWDQLLAQQNQPTPFLSYAFLHALHDSGCASAKTGWQPQYLILQQEQQLVAAMPLYVKMHSYGEYVFDWAWADAYQRSGRDYYPKLLSAIPFTPVAGNRLLARDAAARQALLQALLAVQDNPEISSTHILFPTLEEGAFLQQAGMLLRHGVQFHWQNQHYTDFAHFLATLEQKKRKNILAERRKVAQAGVKMRRIPGHAASQADWEFFSLCYQRTYAEHHSSPYLTLEFFLQLAHSMPDNLLLVVAELNQQPIASALLVFDQQVLYGRYWGAIHHLPCLHFETAYYQALEFCIERGIQRFEGGAQGEHKMARGFLPQATCSAHSLREPAFARAVEDFLQRESNKIGEYMHELDERNPFRA